MCEEDAEGCNRGAHWIRQLAVFCDRIALAKRAGFRLSVGG
jgi:hypothetical protein